MRRAAAGWSILLGMVAVAGRAGVAGADSPTTVQAEAGAEIDSNVQRVETGPGLDTREIESAVGRVGAKLDHHGRLGGGTYALRTTSFARLVSNPDAQSESVVLLAGDLKWVHPVGDRPVSLGIGVVGADALALDSSEELLPTCDRRRLDRTFTSVGADALVVMRNQETRTLTLGFGGRRFTYKPCDKFDWSGPAVNVRLDLTLWEASGGTRALELAAFGGVEARTYNDVALANACTDGEMPPSPDQCSAATSLTRHDRYQRIGAELTWVDRVVAAIGYQLVVTDTNSYGQALVRHRVNLAATTALPWSLYGTALMTLQYDVYLDGLIVAKDLQNQTFTTLDDENRSSLQIRIARQVTRAWALESRLAYWRDIGGSDDSSFRRSLLYIGGVYNH